MSHDLDPAKGRWYRDLDKDHLFRVVAIDADHDVIELQHFDGEREEIDSGAWVEMDLDKAEAPEDWVPPAGDDDKPDDWRDREEKEAKDDEDEDEDDDWDEDEDDEDDDDDRDDDDDSRDDY
jgi:hypothetical protein